jgi:hypothetical protein
MIAEAGDLAIAGLSLGRAALTGRRPPVTIATKFDRPAIET